MPGWKFLTNHAFVLCLIAQQPRITAREISSTINITEKATRNIINDLEADGYITKKEKDAGLDTGFIPNNRSGTRYSRTRQLATSLKL